MDLEQALRNRNNLPDTPQEELVLRELLCIHHGCSQDNLYWDDGEMQCSNPKHLEVGFIDFRRDSPELLKWKLGNPRYREIYPRPE